MPEKKISLEHIIEVVIKALDVSQGDLLSRTRALRVANARSLICHVAYASGHRGVDIASRLNISGPGVTVAARRGKEIIANYPVLLALME